MVRFDHCCRVSDCPKSDIPVDFDFVGRRGQAILETFVGVATKLVGFFSDLKK